MQADFERFKELKTTEEKEAFKICLEKIRKHKLEMKLIKVEYTFDNNKVLFYFTADGRIDFRQLVKDLAAIFKKAILRDKLGELPEAISFSYIAKKYFGKSRNWLYQRINGNIVNGKKARFTDNELKTFLNALNDVSEMIHQTSLKIS